MNPRLIRHCHMIEDPIFGAAAVTCAARQTLSAALESRHPRLPRDPLSLASGDSMLRQAQSITALSTALQLAVTDYLGSLHDMIAHRDDIPF
ncbi:MAG: hypothetical protein H6717_34455 [Polyangiaceae bacterium]|nr:hypothetical protein [Polyangiaceae bacterium]MCB9576791.1 hypothetical protein [Polyangiaceae bacterium]MCB9582187.1 hypothetical protein [Polyangiaceae bacterium]